MDVRSVLSAIESGIYNLELNLDNSVPSDQVLFGALTEKGNISSGADRREFVFRGEEQVVFLAGIADILNKPRKAVFG